MAAPLTFRLQVQPSLSPPSPSAGFHSAVSPTLPRAAFPVLFVVVRSIQSYHRRTASNCRSFVDITISRGVLGYLHTKISLFNQNPISFLMLGEKKGGLKKDCISLTKKDIFGIKKEHKRRNPQNRRKSCRKICISIKKAVPLQPHLKSRSGAVGSSPGS